MNAVSLSKLNDEVRATNRVTITPAVRNSANAYFMQPSMRAAKELRADLLIAMTPSNRLLSMPDTPTNFTPASTISPRVSRPPLNAYSRMGTPGSPTTNRRARSVTPMSVRRPTPQPNSNSNQNNNSSRVSAPKRPQKILVDSMAKLEDFIRNTAIFGNGLCLVDSALRFLKNGK